MKAINQRQPQSKKIKIDSRETTFVDKLTVLLRRFAHKIIKLDVDIYPPNKIYLYQTSHSVSKML